MSSQNLQVDDLDYVTQVILKEAKEEDRLTNQLLITMLSAYSKNPINLLINERSGVGKNYVINKVAAAFPKSDILMLASMTEKALFHRPGILVIQNEETGEYESIESQLYDIQEEILEKEKEISLADKYSKADLKNEIKQIEKKRNDLLKESKKLIDLSNKILIFLDTPPEKLINGLLPLLSHDQYEVEYEYVDVHNGIKTKNNVLRGWPAVIIAHALDYSNSPRYQEYERRFITTNPTMTQKKYNDAIDYICYKNSVPDEIYQDNIVSDEQKQKAKEIIIQLKEQTLSISNNVKPGVNSTLIPFEEIIRKTLPKNRPEDTTRANRLHTYLTFLPTVYFYKRPRLEISRNIEDDDLLSKLIRPIATFEDLLNTVYLMEYSDGVRPRVLEWYYDVFLETFKAKTEKDSKVDSKGNLREETKIAVTSTDLIEKHKEKNGEILTSKQLLNWYLYPLLNHGYIDKTDSVVDTRAYIYFPIIETKEYSNLFFSSDRNKFSQEKPKIVVKSTIFPNRQFIHSVFEPILRYYSQKGLYVKIKNHLDQEITLEELVNQYFGNPEEYFEVRKEKEPTPPATEEEKSKICKCYYCPAEFDTPKEHLKHSVNTHPGKEAQPSKALIEHMKKELGYDIESKGNPWE